MKVLVIAAHPDDEILGVGGTAARHVDQQDEVKLAVMCEGVSMRYDAEHQTAVFEHMHAAAARLGVTDLHVGDLPDQRLDTLPLVDVVARIESLFEAFRPERVYTHFGGDINRDHQVLAEATLVAARPYAAPYLRELLMYETPSSTEWGSPTILPTFQAQLFVDIQSTLQRKIDAFRCYSAELRDPPHPRSPEALTDRARYWGSLVGLGAAEPFAIVRSLR